MSDGYEAATKEVNALLNEQASVDTEMLSIWIG